MALCRQCRSARFSDLEIHDVSRPILVLQTGYNPSMRVTVGVSGGIAAYKAAELVRALQRQALDVHVVMTEAACKFIQPLTFAALTGYKVITGLWPSSPGEGDLDSSIEHIGEAQTTAALV